MIFEKKQILVWCDDPPEDPVIAIFAGCLANHDHTHRLRPSTADVSALSNLCMRPYASSLCGLKILLFEVLSY